MQGHCSPSDSKLLKAAVASDCRMQRPTGAHKQRPSGQPSRLTKADMQCRSTCAEVHKWYTCTSRYSHPALLCCSSAHTAWCNTAINQRLLQAHLEDDMHARHARQQTNNKRQQHTSKETPHAAKRVGAGNRASRKPQTHPHTTKPQQQPCSSQPLRAQMRARRPDLHCTRACSRPHKSPQ